MLMLLLLKTGIYNIMASYSVKKAKPKVKRLLTPSKILVSMERPEVIESWELSTAEIKIDLSIQTLELSLPLVSSSLASPPAQDSPVEPMDIFSKAENWNFTQEKSESDQWSLLWWSFMLQKRKFEI